MRHRNPITVLLLIFGMLFTSVIWERYRDWQTDPYKDVQR